MCEPWHRYQSTSLGKFSGDVKIPGSPLALSGAPGSEIKRGTWGAPDSLLGER